MEEARNTLKYGGCSANPSRRGMGKHRPPVPSSDLPCLPSPSYLSYVPLHHPPPTPSSRPSVTPRWSRSWMSGVSSVGVRPKRPNLRGGRAVAVAWWGGDKALGLYLNPGDVTGSIDLHLFIIMITTRMASTLAYRTLCRPQWHRAARSLSTTTSSPTTPEPSATPPSPTSSPSTHFKIPLRRSAISCRWK